MTDGICRLYAHEKTTSNSAPLCKDKVTLESAPKHGSLYVDLQGCNVGLQAFHPDSIVQNGNSLAGLSGMGGVWEWTSSVLEEWDGFQAMKEYPGYTGKFIIGLNALCIGGRDKLLQPFVFANCDRSRLL